MKIVYFTGTGNSFDAAERLGGELIDVTAYLGENVAENTVGEIYQPITDDVVGIVYPVYAADLPKPMADFLQNVDINADYIFAVATAGSREGKTFGTVQSLLNARGAHLSYAACLTMPDSVILFPTSEENQKREMELLPDRILRIQKAVEGRKKVEIPPCKYNSFSTKFQWFFLRYVLGIRRKSANPEVCTRCKKCENCPVKNISVGKEGVTFGDRCVDCFRCIQICPVNAIRFGRVKRTEKTRYINKNFLARGAKK